jgi:hypothetical protein
MWRAWLDCQSKPVLLRAYANLVARKYDYRTNTYSIITDAEISLVMIAGQKVVKISYDIVDGGPLDEDGLVNGTIIDPSGPAVLGSTLGIPNTGLEAQSIPELLISGFFGLTMTALGVRMLTRRARDRLIKNEQL